MANWSEGDVQTNGVRIHYYRTGHGDKPALLLLHGFSDNGLCWTPVAKALEADYDIVMTDARGHGLSSGAEDGDYSQAAMAADAAAVIRALGLQKPRVMGHSMGGGTASRLAADYPELVHSVILEDAAIFIRPPQPPAEEQKEGEQPRPRPWQWLYDVRAQTREERIASMRKSRPSWSDEELGPWADSKEQLNPDLLEGRARPVDPGTSPFDIIQRITCPILLITADTEQGAIVTPEAVEKAASVWRDGQVVHIAGAGHNIRREQFDQFMTTVKKFLSEK